MDPPPLPTTTTTTNYTDSVSSSPRSYDEPPPPQPPQKLRLMISYGGHILPRPHDKHLSYIGGDTRIFVTDRHVSLSSLSSRLSKTLFQNKPFLLKYQLPNDDLDSLISVTTDEDLDNMIEEYDRINTDLVKKTTSTSSSRLRLFLFPATSSTSSSIGSIRSDDWFVNALNSGLTTTMSNSTRVFSESSSVNNLLGLDDDVVVGNINKPSTRVDVSDLDKTSSFGSTCSSQSMANLPPIRVGHVEENHRPVTGSGIEERLSDMNVKAAAAALSSPVVTGNVGVVGGEYGARVVSDDERSEQGGSVAQRRNVQTQQYPPQQFFAMPGDLPSPDSMSRDGSVTNPLSRQRHYIYQEPGVQIQSVSNRVSGNSAGDPNSRGQVQQQVQEAGFVLPVHYDQHAQMHHSPQYVHTGQYIHHTPNGPVPVTSYFPIYQSQQQQQSHSQHPALEHPYPIYFVPARPTQAYTLPVQQTSYSETAPTAPSSRPQTPPQPTAVTPSGAYNLARNPPPSNPEIVTGGYRTATAASPQLVQLNAGQHQPQYVVYSQVNHPSQSITPSSAAGAANYPYEFADPTHAQIYYTQPLNPQAVAQYQTVTSNPAVGLPESSSQLPTENVKQQIRTSQP